MPYNYGGQDVKCPFYMYERERAIHCEGLIKNARNTINTFNGKKDLKANFAILNIKNVRFIKRF